MGHFAIYHRETGEIVMTVVGERGDAEANAGADHEIVEGAGDPRTHRVDPATGQIIERPAAAATPLPWRAARRAAYPPLGDLADAIVASQSGDPAPMAAYVAACLKVKADFPKD